MIAAALCLPLALPLPELRAVDAAAVVYLGAIQIGLGYVLLNRGVRGLPALEVSLLILVEPVLNALWAWLLLAEAPGSWSIAGCALILLATLVRVVLPAPESSVAPVPPES